MKMIFVGLFIILGFTPVFAQDAVGSIAGIVRDLNGAPVAEASVYAIDLKTFEIASMLWQSQTGGLSCVAYLPATIASTRTKKVRGIQTPSSPSSQ